MKKYIKKSGMLADMFKHLKSFASISLSAFSDNSFSKGFNDAGGFKAIVMAFQGKTASEIEEKILYDKIKKEEEIRQRIRDEFEKENQL